MAQEADDYRTDTERTVANIWKSVLSCAAVRADDDFIQLGGDSVMMMMVLFQVQEKFSVELPAGVLLKSPKLRDFCALIDYARTQGCGDAAVSRGADALPYAGT